RNHLQAITSQAAQPIEQLLQRMEMSTQQGGQTIANYIQQLEKETRALEADVARLQQTGTLITSSSQQSTQSAEQLIERLGALQQNQERLSTEGLTAAERFAQVLQANMASLGKQAATSAEQLQHASQTVATETQNLQQTARQGAVTLSQTSQAMQQDITQLRALTQKQTGDLIGDLGRLQQQLQAMGEQLKTRCDDAYAMLDRTIAHSQTAGQHITTEIAARTKQISEQTSLISNRYDTLNTTLAKTIENIEHAAGRFGQSSANTTQMAERTVKQLEGVVERTGRTSEHVAHMVGQGIAKLDEMGLGLQRQSAAVAEGAQQAVVSLNKAISSFSEQLTRLSEISTQSDQQVRVLTGTASAMGEHAASLRNELQRQHERTQEEMQQVVAGLQRTGQELQHVVATALLGAEQSSARFGDISQQVAQQMSVNTTQLQQQTREAEHALLQTQAQLEAAASHLTQQVSTLTSQQQTLTVANDNQQAELANWFKRLGEAHQQSASAAAHASQRLEEMLIQLTRMMAQCSEQAQMSAQQLRLATGGMGEQASSMLANAQAVEHQMRAMTVATQTLSEQATKSREQTLAETQRASEALAELVGQLDGSTERIRYLSEKSAEDIAKLADHAATAKATQSQFSEALRTQHTELASANENARRELQQLVGNMTDALRTLLTGQQEMQAANGKFTGIMESMQQGIVDLAETANSTEDRLVVRQQSLAAGLRDINSLVTDAQTRLQNTQALATHTTATLQEALEKIEKNTAWMVDATGLGRQQLQSELDQLKGLKDQAAVALASYRHDLESLMHKVSETSAMGTSQAERTQHQLAQTLNSLNTATGQMTQLQTLSAEAIKLVEDRMASLGRQVESTGQVLQQNHHIFGNLQTAQESLGQMMTQATQRVEQLCEHTRQVARQTLADVQNMVADLQHLPQAGGQQLASKAVLLREVAEQSGRLMEGFNTQIETMLSRLTSASEVMRQQDRSLNDEAQRALRQIETMTTQLTITRDIVGGMSEQMLQKLTTVNNETTKQLGSIERAADDASGRMQQAATTWQRHAQALADGTTTARGEILALNHTLDALHRKADLVRGDLQSQTQHIVSALAQILAQLEETGETIQQVSDPLVDRIEYNLKQIG
ncbi:MAG: hypothetical protein EBQ89_09835, partial [Alphaproteobacteria bacterium]|nr:hypothetical protein [Alphaproteobacteria bacterium]